MVVLLFPGSPSNNLKVDGKKRVDVRVTFLKQYSEFLILLILLFILSLGTSIRSFMTFEITVLFLALCSFRKVLSGLC